MSGVKPVVFAEELIAAVSPFNNGAGPFWCFGSSVMVRRGNKVFATVPEVSTDVPPLCNTRWRLLVRKDGGSWTEVWRQHAFTEREPCPLVCLPDGRLIVSVNPSTGRRGQLPDGRWAHTCVPRLVCVSPGRIEKRSTLRPAWNETHGFTEHSYRSIAVDADTGNLFLAHQVRDPRGGHSHAWCFRDGRVRWLANGWLRFPMRGCYHQVQVVGRAVHVLAISDEIEPVREWREYKQKVTGQNWDYEFRQLFYTWTPDITRQDFSPPTTIATRDETAGYVRHLDLWVDPDGVVHVMYLERNIWHRYMRDRFFPDTPMTVNLKLARLRNGRVVGRDTLLSAAEDMNVVDTDDNDAWNAAPRLPMLGTEVVWGAFHVTRNNELYAVTCQRTNGRTTNTIRQIHPRLARRGTRIGLNQVMERFFVASPRSGCKPAKVLDLYGQTGRDDPLRYAQVELVGQ